jgi:hypothetical protein
VGTDCGALYVQVMTTDHQTLTFDSSLIQGYTLLGRRHKKDFSLLEHNAVQPLCVERVRQDKKETSMTQAACNSRTVRNVDSLSQGYTVIKLKK